ncbi:DUF4377 domain-containing protein [Carboxylicivirga taeanensis]|uniref:DUF4377 domain-containing protein n=1 Tax=Carboxylicivirga taeanensis TaxID=1416875 RepID=UPI003F6E02F3
MKKLLYSILILGLASCSFTGSKKKDASTETIKTYYVAPYKVDCVGVGPMKCLLIKKSPNDQWQNFYASIIGFTHQPGTEYTIKVKETPVENAPADASSISYELVEITESKAYAPTAIILHDIWGVVDIKGKNPLSEGCEQTLELNLNENTILGKGGCNNFRGQVNVSDASNAISFTNILSTKAICPHQALEDSYLTALGNIDSYFRFNQNLYLMSNNEVLVKLRRMD